MYSGGYEADMLQKRITVDQLNQVEVYARGLISAKYVALCEFMPISLSLLILSIHSGFYTGHMALGHSFG